MWRFSIGLLARKAVSAAAARRILHRKSALGALTGVGGGAAVRSLSPAMRKRLMELLKIRGTSSTPPRRRSPGTQSRSKSSVRQPRSRKASTSRRTSTKSTESKSSARKRSVSTASSKRKKQRNVSTSRKRSRRKKGPPSGSPTPLNSHSDGAVSTVPVTTPMIATTINWPAGSVVGSRNAVPSNSSTIPAGSKESLNTSMGAVSSVSNSASILDPPPRLHYLLATAVATVVVPIIANDMLEGMRHVVTKASREPDSAAVQKNGNQQIEEYYMANKGPLFATAVIAGTNAVKLSSTLLPLCHPVSIQKCSFTFRRRTLPQTSRPSALPHRVVLRKRTTPPSSIVPRRQEFSILYCFCTVATNEQKVGGVEMEALAGATAAATTMYDMLRHLPCAQEDGLMLGEAFVLAKRGGRSDFIKLLMSEPDPPSQSTTTTSTLPLRSQIAPSPVTVSSPSPRSAPLTASAQSVVSSAPPVPAPARTPALTPTTPSDHNHQKPGEDSKVSNSVISARPTPAEGEILKAKEIQEDQEDEKEETSAADESDAEEGTQVGTDDKVVDENLTTSNDSLSAARPITVVSSSNKRARAPAPPVDTSIPKPAPPSSRGLPPIPRSGGPSNGDVVSWWQSTPQERRLQEHNPRRRYGEGRLSPITLAEKKLRKGGKDEGTSTSTDDHEEIEEVPIHRSSSGKRLKRKKVVKVVRKAPQRTQSPDIPDYTHDEDEVADSLRKNTSIKAENRSDEEDGRSYVKKAVEDRNLTAKKEKIRDESEGKKKGKKMNDKIATPGKSALAGRKGKSDGTNNGREEGDGQGVKDGEDGEGLYTTVDHSDWDTLTTTLVEDGEEEGSANLKKEKKSKNLEDEEDFIPPPPREKPNIKKKRR